MKRKVLMVFCILLFICGILVALYPKLTEWKASYESEKVLEDFKDDLTEIKQEEDLESTNNENNNLSKLYNDMKAYNQELYESGQIDLKDPFSYETPSFDLTEYGFKNNVAGIINIPKINEELPLYLGANKENMTKGAVVLGETSMPTGDINSNVVIAAHRGYRGIKMFRDIEKIELDDEIIITTPYDSLIYKVTEIKIVEKDDIGEIFIKEGKDMITLVTCHPYTQNTHRYLVFAERNHNEEEPKDEEIQGTNSKEENLDNDNHTDLENINKESSSDFSEKRIWLEDNLLFIGIGVIFIIIIIGFILTGKKNK